MQLKLHISPKLCRSLAGERKLVRKYETTRSFRAYAFYLRLRSNEKGRKGIYINAQSEYAFCKTIAEDLEMHPSTVAKRLEQCVEFGFMRKVKFGYHFRSLQNILSHHGITDELTIPVTITQHDNLEHILKTFVISENYNRQMYCVLRKVHSNPVKTAKLNLLIPQWKQINPLDLLATIVQMQQQSFALGNNSGADYDFLHSIHADISLSLKGINKNFLFKGVGSAKHLKKTLAKSKYIAIQHRKTEGEATRPAKDVLTGESKPMTLLWLPKQHKRCWLQADEIILTTRIHKAARFEFKAQQNLKNAA